MNDVTHFFNFREEYEIIQIFKLTFLVFIEFKKII